MVLKNTIIDQTKHDLYQSRSQRVLFLNLVFLAISSTTNMDLFGQSSANSLYRSIALYDRIGEYLKIDQRLILF
jgi:hypothetical protein